MYPLPPPTHNLPTINIPHQRGTFITIHEPTSTHHYHPKSIVYIRINSWWCMFYGFWQMYLTSYIMMAYRIVSALINCPKTPLFSAYSSPLPPNHPTPTYPLTVTIVLSIAFLSCIYHTFRSPRRINVASRSSGTALWVHDCAVKFEYICSWTVFFPLALPRHGAHGVKSSGGSIWPWEDIFLGSVYLCLSTLIIAMRIDRDLKANII